MFEKLFSFKDWKIKTKFDQSFRLTIASEELKVRNKVVELGG